jgi:hypothetical protein
VPQTNGLPSSFNYNEKKEMMNLFFSPEKLHPTIFFFPWQFDQKRAKLHIGSFVKTHLLPWMISPCGHTMKSSSREIIQEKI